MIPPGHSFRAPLFGLRLVCVWGCVWGVGGGAPPSGVPSGQGGLRGCNQQCTDALLVQEPPCSESRVIVVVFID